MKRPPPAGRAAGLLPCGLAALAGAMLLLALPALPPLTLCAAAAIVLSCACVRLAPRHAPLVLAATAAFLWAAIHARQVLAHRWPEAEAGARVLAVVTVDSIPVPGPHELRFEASLRLDGRPRVDVLRARVIWPHGASTPHAGERWRLMLALHPPRARLNPHAHDGERTLFREHVHAVARVVPSRLNVRLSAGHRPLAQLRERIAQRIEAGTSDRDAAALITALAVGHTGGMSREQWRVFNVTGTAHLVAISGLHVTLFAVVAIGMARLAWRVVPRSAHVPRDAFAAALGLAAAAAYAMLAGLSVPTQRTLIMLGAWYGARAVARHTAPGTPLATALIAVLVVDPFAPLAAGFWLSFIAMAAIVLVTGTSPVRQGSVHEALRVQGAVVLVLAPVTLAWFGSVSIIGIATNLIAIPVVSFLFVPLILLAVVSSPWDPLATMLLSVAAIIHGALWPWLAAAADASHSMLFVSPPAWWCAAAGGAVLFAVLPWPTALRAASVLWLVPLLPNGAISADELELTMLDTGPAAAIVVRSADAVLIRGIGAGFADDGRAIETAMIPVLRGRGISRVDVLVLPGTTRRARPGLDALLANVTVSRVLAAGPRPAPVPGAAPCEPERWSRRGVEFRVLAPDCSVMVTMGRTRVLLKGDAATVSQGSPRARADIVLLAASPTQSTRAVERARADAARVLTTASSGAITIRLTPAGIVGISEERARSRLWRGTGKAEG